VGTRVLEGRRDGFVKALLVAYSEGSRGLRFLISILAILIVLLTILTKYLLIDFGLTGDDSSFLPPGPARRSNLHVCYSEPVE
jgi:hypothetical protein